MKHLETHRNFSFKNLFIKSYDTLDWFWFRGKMKLETALLKRKRQRILGEEVTSILLIRLGSLGDVVRVSAVAEALKREYPNAAVDVLTSAHCKIIFEDNPYIRKRYSVEEINELPRYDWLVNLQVPFPAPEFYPPDKYKDLISEIQRITQPRFSTGNRMEGDRFVRSHTFNYYCYLEIEEIFRLALLSCPKDAAHRPRIFAPAGITRPAEFGLPEHEQVVGVFIGSQTVGGYEGGFRAYSIEYLEALVSELSTFSRVAVFGTSSVKTPAEMAKYHSFIKQNSSVIDLVDRTTLPELLDLLRLFKVVVANDSGPLHLAIALQRKTVALFVHSIASRLGPSSETVVGLNAFEPCNELSWRWRHHCTGCRDIHYKLYGCNLKEFPKKQDLLPGPLVVEAVRNLLA